MSFGTNGKVTGGFTAGDDTLGSIIVESDGSILVGATLDTANDASSTAALIHFEPDGSLDIGFGTGGVLDLPSVPAGFGVNMVQQPDGKLLFLVGGGDMTGQQLKSSDSTRTTTLTQPSARTESQSLRDPDFHVRRDRPAGWQDPDQREQRSHGNGHAAQRRRLDRHHVR